VKTCPNCSRGIADAATACDQCGFVLPASAHPTSVPPPNFKSLYGTGSSSEAGSSNAPQQIPGLPLRYVVWDRWRGRILATAAGAVGLALILVVLGLPGGGSHEGGSFPALAQAATKLQELRSVRIHLTELVEDRQANQRVKMTGHGVSALGSGNGRFSIRFSGASLAEGSSSEHPMADGSRMIAIYHDPSVYFGGQVFAGQLPDNAAWMKIDLQRAAMANGTNLEAEQGTAQGNPADLLPYLRATGEVEDLGPARISGRSTTHYRARIDPQRYTDVLRTEGQTQAAESVESALKRGLQVGGIDVWLDEQQRVRRMELSFSIPSPAGGTVQVSVAMGLSDYGVRVPATQPPAAKVFDGTSLAQQSSARPTGYLSPKEARAAGEVPPAPSHAGSMTSDWKTFAVSVDETCASVFNASNAASAMADQKAARRGVPGYKRDSMRWAYTANAMEREYRVVKAMGDPPAKAGLFHRWLRIAGERARLMRTMTTASANRDGALESRTYTRITQLKKKANQLGQRFGLRICTSN
jgi:hypothetical protein